MENGKCTATLNGEIKCSVSWIIPSIKNRPEENGEKITSDPFDIILPDGQKTSWEIWFYPKGGSQRDTGKIPVYLTLKSKNSEDISVFFQCPS